jgi:hypothetical protein
MECSICFEIIQRNKFFNFLKKNQIDICNNKYKCIDNICIKCIYFQTHNNINKYCPLCRDSKFEYLGKFYIIHLKFFKLNNEINNLQIIKDKNISERVNKIFLYLLESFENCIRIIENSEKYVINYYLDDLIININDLFKILKKCK